MPANRGPPPVSHQSTDCFLAPIPTACEGARPRQHPGIKCDLSHNFTTPIRFFADLRRML